ncbi:MAG: LuxR C-terminal-related transcriptional regulator [Coriobacteriales bacterium]|jgi:DNA-binding CsgD family transcriptional regulator|nr:LuxR C-terminal-related transcriptional regulator [Coriobacteriales bacterium]
MCAKPEDRCGEETMKDRRRTSRKLADSLGGLWPGLRYLGLGIWLVWAFLAYSGTVWLSDTEIDGGNLSTMYLVSTSACALVLLFAPFFSRRFEHILSSRNWIMASGLIAMVGAGGIILAGPFYLGIPVLFWIGNALTGIGTGVLALKLGQLYGELQPRRALVYTLLSQLLVVLLYSFVIGNETFQPVPGGPSLGGILALMCLPVLAAWVITIGQPRTNTADLDDPKPETDYQRRISQLTPAFWKFLFAVFIFTFATSVVRGFFTYLRPPSDILTDSNNVMLLRALVVIVFLLVAIRFLQHINFGKLYLFFMVILAIAVAVTPLLNIYNQAITAVVSLSSNVLDFLVWCLLAFIVSEKRIAATIVFGFGRGIFMAGCAIGWFVGGNVIPMLSGSNWETAFYIALAFLILLSTTLVFSEKDFDRLFTPIAEGELSLDDLITETAGASRLAETPEPERPYMIACESVGEEAHLSVREQDILNLLALGRGTENIAKKLSISLNTVRTHTHNIYAKLDVHSRQELVELIEAKRNTL